jgi:predicted phage-related endonuclease
MTIERRAVAAREQWLQWRKTDLTASDLGAVAGVDDYRSPLAVYAEKRGLIIPEETPLMRRGRWFESAASSALSETLEGWTIENPHAYYREVETRLACTPDRFGYPPSGELVNIQIKTIAAPSFEAWEGIPPLSYQIQTAAEGYLVDAARSLLAVLVVSTYGAELELFDVPRHAAAEEKCRQLALEFWRNMEAGLMPAADYRRDGGIIAAMNPHAVPAKVADLSSDNRLHEILPRRAELKAVIKTAVEEVETIDAELREKMADAETGELPGWKLSLKMQQRKESIMPAWSGRVLRVTDRRKGGDQ